jgi:putative tryptophan/tyrosine transport system substrate-binding protein
MRRRDFIKSIASATIAWPVSARGQQPGRVFRVGWFFSSTPLEEMAGPDPLIPVGKTFVHALRSLGYVEGHNLVLERRSAEGKFDLIPKLAAELVSRNPDVIVTGSGNRLAQELQRVTKSVPIVIPDSDDPVGAGLVESLARPGTNVTGFSADAGPGIESKRLELLKEAVPNATRVAVLATKQVWDGPIGRQLRSAAQIMHLALVHAEHFPDSYDGAFALIARDHPDALVVTRHAANYVNRQLIADFALRQKLPAIYPYKANALDGGMMSYAVDENDLFYRTAVLVDKILRGTNPADIPIEQPSKFELVINLKTASAIGINMPPTLLTFANEVIE